MHAAQWKHPPKMISRLSPPYDRCEAIPFCRPRAGTWPLTAPQSLRLLLRRLSHPRVSSAYLMPPAELPASTFLLLPFCLEDDPAIGLVFCLEGVSLSLAVLVFWSLTRGGGANCRVPGFPFLSFGCCHKSQTSIARYNLTDYKPNRPPPSPTTIVHQHHSLPSFATIARHHRSPAPFTTIIHHHRPPPPFTGTIHYRHSPLSRLHHSPAPFTTIVHHHRFCSACYGLA